MTHDAVSRFLQRVLSGGYRIRTVWQQMRLRFDTQALKSKGLSIDLYPPEYISVLKAPLLKEVFIFSGFAFLFLHSLAAAWLIYLSRAGMTTGPNRERAKKLSFRDSLDIADRIRIGSARRKEATPPVARTMLVRSRVACRQVRRPAYSAPKNRASQRSAVNRDPEPSVRVASAAFSPEP